MEITVPEMQPLIEWATTSGVRILIVLAGMLITLIVMMKILRQVEKGFQNRFNTVEAKKRVNTLMGVLRMIVRTVILVIGLMIILSEIGINMGPLLATVGVLGLAVSFGAQTLVKDFISGIFLLLEDNLRVGDVVEINGLSGTVEAIHLRLVVLRSVGGDLHVIPNGQVMEFTNMTKDFSRALWNVGVGYSEDVDRVMEVIRDEGKKLVEDENLKPKILSELKIMGLQEMGDSALVIRCLLDTTPGEQWGITREFNRRLKKRFDLEGIEIPFPHRTIYYGNSPSDVAKTKDTELIQAVNKGDSGESKDNA